MSDVIVRSRVKSGEILMVSTGAVEVRVGGVMTIYESDINKNRKRETRFQ